MSNLPNPAPVTPSAECYWSHCTSCDALFPAAPGQLRCPQCGRTRPRDPCHLDPLDRSSMPDEPAERGER